MIGYGGIEREREREWQEQRNNHLSNGINGRKSSNAGATEKYYLF